MSEAIERLVHTQAITEQIYRYARGVDRMERSLARACWHGDGTADYRGMFEGSADALLDWMWQVHAGMQMHSHQMSNILIDLRGEVASSETYVTATLLTREDPPSVIATRARYLDRWSLRAGSWAIDHRICVPDITTLRRTPESEAVPSAGRRDRSDPSYALFD